MFLPMQARWPAPNCKGELVSECQRVEKKRSCGLEGESQRCASCVERRHGFCATEGKTTNSKQARLHSSALFVITI